MRTSGRLSLALCFALIAISGAARAGTLSPASAAAWQRDLDYMVRSIEKFHVNAFHDVSRAVFEQRAAALRARMPRLNRAQAILGLASIIALVRDAHTGFGIGTGPPISFHALPIKVYQYSDGVFIQALWKGFDEISSRYNCRFLAFCRESRADSRVVSMRYSWDSLYRMLFRDASFVLFEYAVELHSRDD